MDMDTFADVKIFLDTMIFNGAENGDYVATMEMFQASTDIATIIAGGSK